MTIFLGLIPYAALERCSFSIVAAVEMDDASHLRPESRRRDIFLEEVRLLSHLSPLGLLMEEIPSGAEKDSRYMEKVRIALPFM
ncbi:hypothetical protein NGB58_21950 [Escherichia coli]|nr:hypothetical protein [Escherichia coli]